MHDRDGEGLGVCCASVLHHILCRTRVVGGDGGVDGENGANVVVERRELDPMQHLSEGKEGWIHRGKGKRNYKKEKRKIVMLWEFSLSYSLSLSLNKISLIPCFISH